jgi:hypothetical protein
MLDPNHIPVPGEKIDYARVEPAPPSPAEPKKPDPARQGETRTDSSGIQLLKRRRAQDKSKAKDRSEK